MTTDLLTVKEFADRIRVHPGTIYRRIREQRQPGVHRFGRDLRIDLAVALLPTSARATPPAPASQGHNPGLTALYTRV